MRINIKQYISKLSRFRDEKGLSLVESIVAVAIIGVVIVVFIAALSTGSIAVREGSQAIVSQRLALTQLEYIKGCPYATTYSTIDTPEGYTVTVGIMPTPDKDQDIQKITVAVLREGENILTVEDYKVNR